MMKELKRGCVIMLLCITLVTCFTFCRAAKAEEVQKAIFPFRGRVNITQGADGYINRYFNIKAQGSWWMTHQPTYYDSRLPVMYALDFNNNGNLVAYAPFDATVVYRGTESDGNEVILQSVNKLLLRDGTKS